MYNHGLRAEYGSQISQKAEQFNAGIVYIGTAPIHHLNGGYEEKVNKPTTIRNMTEAKAVFGYSDDWEKFTLCEVFDRHFNSGVSNIGPIHVINVLDPSINIKENKTSIAVEFKNNKAVIDDDLLIVDTVSIQNKTVNVDFSVDFIDDKCVITDLKGALASVTVEYYQVDTTEDIIISQIIGNDSDGIATGINALKFVYQDCGVPPMLVGCPKFSSLSNVKTALATACDSINGRFKAQYAVDIPLVDEDGNDIDTVEKAIQWKADNLYNDKLMVALYPGIISGKKKRHLSVDYIVEKMRKLMNADGIPYESASNVVINVDQIYFGKNALINCIDFVDAEKLNAKGINTVIFNGGNYRLWGGHTAAFDSNSTTLSDEVFDTNISMAIFLANRFMFDNAELIDKPMTTALLESIQQSEELLLDSLISIGALTGNPTFVVSDTIDESSIASGSYGWVLNETPTPQFKDAFVKVVFTPDGYKALIGGTANEEE